MHMLITWLLYISKSDKSLTHLMFNDETLLTSFTKQNISYITCFIYIGIWLSAVQLVYKFVKPMTLGSNKPELIFTNLKAETNWKFCNSPNLFYSKMLLKSTIG
jgi:hypothetical protein